MPAGVEESFTYSAVLAILTPNTTSPVGLPPVLVMTAVWVTMPSTATGVVGVRETDASTQDAVPRVTASTRLASVADPSPGTSVIRVMV